MKLAPLLLVSALATTSASLSIAAPVQVDSGTYGGHTYILLSPDGWFASEEAAVALGGHLVTINDSAEDAWVFERFKASGRYLWLGLNDIASEGTYMWVSGDTSSYLNWADGEPNNGAGGPDDDVTAYFAVGDPRAGLWADARDGEQDGNFYGIVEVVTPVPVPGSLGLLGIGLAGLGLVRRKAKA